MTLTEEDIRRINSLGFKDYCELVDGYIQLININGRCFFFREGRCLIHTDKPLGCKLYPLVYDIDKDEVVFHDFCEYLDMFNFDDGDRETLKETIQVEERERRRRLAKNKK